MCALLRDRARWWYGLPLLRYPQAKIAARLREMGYRCPPAVDAAPRYELPRSVDPAHVPLVLETLWRTFGGVSLADDSYGAPGEPHRPDDDDAYSLLPRRPRRVLGSQARRSRLLGEQRNRRALDRRPTVYSPETGRARRKRRRRLRRARSRQAPQGRHLGRTAVGRCCAPRSSTRPSLLRAAQVRGSTKARRQVRI
mmetsp:Transcript_7246/g.30070  ORF Transcript_7246/g.30070 Transcript_7246/m.30070 type:complete len:197 (+) Transcript_7246:307-897(+)